MNNRMFFRKDIFKKSLSVHELIFVSLGFLCLSPLISPPIALLIGILTAQWLGNPFPDFTHKLTHILLQVSVVGLGFGMDVESAIHASKSGFILTVISLFAILFLGYFIGRLLRIDRKIAFLITVGTAICGGSAIAAMSPVIKAKEGQISVALATIFILNSIALFVFPIVGHFFNLSQEQFGLWSAVAIQDTSSVVGAASKYGEEALQIATSVKLTRALWIIPVTFFSALVFKSKGNRIQVPYFIGLFVLAIIGNTYVAPLHKIAPYIVYMSKSGLTAVLFLIGAGLSAKVIKSVGPKPFILGLVLWGLIAIPSLLFILCFFAKC
ncbi:MULTISPECIES: YeiH family protein [Sphingobacterium]|uniref:YeiH family protein n=1 Tax=Sphingobacterium TaxID=28453 RepID=UPI001969B646|nr:MULTISPECIES: putative sulfate exporter family transporter [unclassified Sphingobacterium]